jgi:hypothetical protein
MIDRDAAWIAAAAGGRLAALSRLRRITAERMAQSARTVARVTLFVEADFAEAVRFRAQLLPEFERRYGARLTYDTMIARACALAMADHPHMNAHWTDQGPLLFEQVDVGVAVALPAGLTVPVVRDVARRPLWDVARSVNDVVTRAQEGRLGPEDFGGTFTITNLGLYGVEGFTPILNPPEVAILGVGAIQPKPVVVDGAVVDVVEKAGLVDRRYDSPPSRDAVVGLYCYPPDVFEVIDRLQPSSRGELEITDVNREYARRGELQVRRVEGWWHDGGKHWADLAEVGRLIEQTGVNK